MLRRSILHSAAFLAVLAGLSASATVVACEQKSARLVALQGGLEIQEGGPDEWAAVTPEREFCPGDRIRTRSQSRATLELSNKTYLSLNQQTTIVFSGIKARTPSWLDLIKGILYVRSRTPSSLDVRTRYVNAAIKGTEFMVSADDSQGQVTVFEGTVESSNAQGSVTLTDGQAAVAKSGEAPVRKLLASPRDAVQWALYYPPVIDLQSLQKRTTDPATKQAAERYLQGDSLGALAALDAAEQPDALLKAGLLIGLGRVEEAQPLLDGIGSGDPRFGEALALRSVVALARNDKTKALELARQATAKQPQSPAAWTALSYARQADFQLDDALQAANEAAKLDPGNALARAREAELLAALGRRRAAKEAATAAAQLNPRLSRVWSVQGYAQLNEMDYEEAMASFRKAIDLDNADPLARFGLGLAKIRAGNLEEGTADLELAANLDPDDALTRSYLGKAYYEQKNSKVAATELDTAKQLDPNDPTPWFYDAIKKQTENRPVEALHDLQKAIELNDNRAIYRSKQMLDDDLAARSSALGRIYNNLGFGQRAVLEGWKSVNADPSDYSGHRFLADTYASLPGHEVARISELLQSQLLQPENVTPVQPHLAERNLLLLYDAGPSVLSFNEFNPLFNRNRLALQTAGLVGSYDTYADEVVQSGLWKNVSYSLGQFHYQTDGYRPNADLNQNIYNAFLQGRIIPDLNLQFEARHRDVESGDITQNVFQDAIPVQNTLRKYRTTDTLRGGAHYAISTNSDLIFSYIHQDESENFKQPPFLPNKLKVYGARGYIAEGQYILRMANFRLVTGGGYYNTENYFHFTSNPYYQVSQGNAYTYSYLDLPWHIGLTLGLSYDELSDESNIKRSQVNPKLGLLWQLTPQTTLRAAGFRTLKRTLAGSQTIEPTQVAGFNQLYDDIDGTEAKRYGVGIDHKFTGNWLVGAEVSRRDMSLHPTVTEQDKAREDNIRSYLYWTPTAQWALSVGYQLERFETEQLSVPETTTHKIPATLSYFHGSGIFGRLGMTYVDQRTHMAAAVDDGGDGTVVNYLTHNQFTLIDVGIGYRLPKRYGIIQFQVKNLFDSHFQYQGYQFRNAHQDEVPEFIPGRAFFGQLSLAF